MTSDEIVQRDRARFISDSTGKVDMSRVLCTVLTTSALDSSLMTALRKEQVGGEVLSSPAGALRRSKDRLGPYTGGIRK